MEIKRRMLVVLPPKTFGLVMHWVQKAAPHEVGGLWEIEQQGDMLIARNPVLSKQRSATDEPYLNHDPEWIMEYQEKAGFMEGVLPVATYGSWHSHGKGGTEASSDDADFIEEHTSRGYFVTTIFNAAAQYKSQVHTLLGEADQPLVLVSIPCVTCLGDGLTSEERVVADESYKAQVTWYKRRTESTRAGYTTQDQGVWDKGEYGCSQCGVAWQQHTRWLEAGVVADHVYQGMRNPIAKIGPKAEGFVKERGHGKPLHIKTTDGPLVVYSDGTMCYSNSGVEFNNIHITDEILTYLEKTLSKKQFKKVARYAEYGRQKPLSPGAPV